MKRSKTFSKIDVLGSRAGHRLEEKVVDGMCCVASLSAFISQFMASSG